LADVLPVIVGVVEAEPAIGGRDSNKEAPNEDVGLKGLRPANPVTCDLTGAIGDVEPVVGVEEKNEVLVTPVG